MSKPEKPAQEPPVAGADGSDNSPCMTVDDCIARAENGEMCCGTRTELAIKTLAAEVRRIRGVLQRIAQEASGKENQ